MYVCEYYKWPIGKIHGNIKGHICHVLQFQSCITVTSVSFELACFLIKRCPTVCGQQSRIRPLGFGTEPLHVQFEGMMCGSLHHGLYYTGIEPTCLSMHLSNKVS